MNNNSFKILDFRLYHNKSQQDRYILFYKIHLYIYIIPIDFNDFKNQIFYHNHFHNRYSSSQTNHYLINSLFYYKTSKINNFNLHMDAITYISISTGLVTINQCPTWNKSTLYWINLTHLPTKMQMQNYSNTLHLTKKRFLHYSKKMFSKLLFLIRFQTTHKNLSLVL